MIKCPECNKELSDGAEFCDGCGCRIPETTFCPNCGEQASAGFAFCRKCGASIAETPAKEQPAAAPVKKKKLPKKAILFGGIGAAAVAVLIIVIVLIFSCGKAGNNYVLYLKDNELFFSDLKKNSEARQLTSRLVSADDADYDPSYESYRLGRCTYMSEDGRYIFFPDKLGESKTLFGLYYKKASDSDAKAVKIDSDIRAYTVNASATLVTYLKGEEGDLYQYDIRKDSREKIASEVDYFAASDDGERVVYVNSENSIYVKYADKKKDKIVSDIYDVIKIYGSGEFYYLTKKAEKVALADYIIDDMEKADASITEPAYPDYPEAPSYPYWEDYDNYDEYEVAYAEYDVAYDAWKAECERIETEYDTAYEAYLAKRFRDELREALKKTSLNKPGYSLCYYDGTKENVITNAFCDETICAEEAPVIYYTAYTQSAPEKVKLSEIENVYEVENKVRDALFSSSEKYIAVGDTATVVEQKKEADEFCINSAGTVIYYIDNIQDGKECGDLYRISVSDGVPEKAELYDSDVCIDYCRFLSDTDFMYFKEIKDGKGELYINKNQIDSDVSASGIVFCSDLGKVFYRTDWSKAKEYGTLKVYDGKESVKIGGDINSFTVTPDGRVLYLYDYSTKYRKGELYEWSDGETRKIDDDVTCILPVIREDYRGYFYGW